MNKQNKPIIPRTLDEPGRSFFGIQDDDLIVAGGVFFVMLGSFDMPFWGMLAGVVSGYVYSAIKSKVFLRKVIRALYWYLPQEISLIRGGIPGHMRRLYLRKKRSDDKGKNKTL